MTNGKRKNAINYGGPMVLLSVFLALTGLMMILSATSISAKVQYMSSFVFFHKQALRLVIGLGVMVAASRIDYHRMQRLSFPLLALSALMLVICLLPGTRSISPVIGGARRWLVLGPLSFQPSELAKFFLVCWAAGYLVRKRQQIHLFKEGFLPFIILVGIFFLLVVVQPDLSTALIFLFIVIVVGFVGGIRIPHLLVLGLFLVPLVTYAFVVKVGYRSERIASYLEGGEDKSGYGYQVHQSKLALGSGGITGVGLGSSKQKYFFLPAAHTDFIFAIIGEELGFVGTFLVVAAFTCLAILGYKIAANAPDYFGFLLACGMTVMILAPALLNMAVVSGLAPTTGMPLPLLSYGGTNLVTAFWAVGILNNISRTVVQK